MLVFEKLQLRQGAFHLHADCSLCVGEKYAVIGPSGAGKSTLLMAISGFLPAAVGRIIWQGQDITNAAPGSRPVSMLFQDNNLFPHLTAAQNIGLGIRPDLKLSPAQQTQVNDALARVGLQGKADSKPAQLSGGQQSRIALARILVQRKPVILLDEPFAALGPSLKSEMLDLVADLSSEIGATLLMVSHDPEDALQITDQAILVADGTVHAPIETRTLLANPPAALRAYLGAPRDHRG